ncbi:MAG: CidA/LrgA family protein [Rhodospirillales bacterium]|nr:CidA/LrgA family protein [Rhodospirillales bacterium]
MQLRFFTLLLICQLAGEIASRGLSLPVSGPVIGMVLLFCGVALRGEAPPGLEAVSSGILRHLSLLFVPAGVGVMTHVQFIADQWLPLTVSLLVSTLLAIAVTSQVYRALARAGVERGDAQ